VQKIQIEWVTSPDQPHLDQPHVPGLRL
jgi:hypothetical protein